MKEGGKKLYEYFHIRKGNQERKEKEVHIYDVNANKVTKEKKRENK